MIALMDYKSSLYRGHRSGLTLIEVVVGLAIAGTLLATTIMAATAQRRQLKQANQKQQAVELIDRFLTAWTQGRFKATLEQSAAESSGVRLRAAGELEDNLFYLQVRSISRVRELELEVIRVEAYVGNAESPISWVEVVRQKREERT